MNAREARVRELLNAAMVDCAGRRPGKLVVFSPMAEEAIRYVAEKLLGELEHLTQSCNRAVRLAAKTTRRK